MIRRVVIMTVAALGILTLPASPSHASWTSTVCYSNSVSDSNVRRSDAQAYVQDALWEGYEWGGGCWNNNNFDDTPGVPDSSGEGPDCSGLVFKAWELKNTFGASGFTFYDKLMNIHGPYTSSSFHAPGSGWPFELLPNKSRSTTMYMDAFAKSGHVGLLWNDSNPGNNTDLMAEALGDAYGVDKFYETYRYDSAYTAVIRKDWTPDCWPSCKGDRPGTVVLP